MKSRIRHFRLAGGLAALAFAVGVVWMTNPEQPEIPERSPQWDDASRSVEGPVGQHPVDRAVPPDPDPGQPFPAAQDAGGGEGSPAGKRESATWERVRIEEQAGPFPFIRYVDEMAPDAVTGEPVILRSVAMLADHVSLSLPEPADPDQVRAGIESLGFTVARAQIFSPVWQIGLGRHDADAVPEALEAIAGALPAVQAEPDFVYFPQRVPDDYDPVVLWGLRRIEAPSAWSVSIGSTEVVVAVIDSGAELDHPDLKPNLWVNPGEIAGNGLDDDGNGLVDDIHGWDFVSRDNRPDDNGRHGTHVAGTVSAAGDNGTGLVGVNWNTRLMVLRVGDQTFPSSLLVQAVDYVTDRRKQGVPVVATNNSYGGSGQSTPNRDAILRSRDAGILFVAAAGNDGLNIDLGGNASYPASYDLANILSVASSNLADELSIFSNYGSLDVDLAAPGSAIRSSIPGRTYGYLSGTSMASPHVAGAVALLKAAEPGLEWEALRDRILGSVDPVPSFSGKVASGGRLNLRRLLGLSGERAVARITVPETRLVVLEESAETLDLAGAVDLADTEFDLRWEAVLGPDGVMFADPASRVTTARFAAPGVYQLRLVATSPSEVTVDEITVVVATPDVSADGLVAFWQFEEDNPAIAIDGSGAGRHGALTGVVRETGPLGKAARFDGSTSSMSFTSPVSTAVTMSAWVRSDSLGESIFPRIVHTPDYIFYLGRRTGDVDADINSIKFYATKTVQDGIWHTRTNAIGDGRWMHVGVSYDGASAENFPSIFLDGELLLVGVDARSGDQARGVVGNQTLTPGTAYLGENDEGDRAWDGLIDEVRIYSQALNRAEMAWIAGESAARPLLDPALTAPDAVGVAVPFTVGLANGGVVAGATYRWDLPVDSGLLFLDGRNGPSPQIIAHAGGPKRLRLVASKDGATVVRSIPVSVAVGVRPEGGLFRGNFQADGVPGEVWAVVDSSGRARFLGVGDEGEIIAAADILISADGQFEFLAADGSGFLGQFDADGFAGISSDGVQAFRGSRVSGTVDGATSFLRGPLVNSEDGRVEVWLGPDGSIFLVRSDSGETDAASGTVDGAGLFSLQASSGARISGLVDLDSFIGRGSIEGEESNEPFFLADETGFSGERLANISTRGVVGLGEAVMIAGFVVEGGSSSLTLLRGVGPGLEAFDLENRSASTGLVLKRNELGLASNQGWRSGPDAGLVETLAEAVGAFPLLSGTGDSALLANLENGIYTVTLSDPSGAGGLALLEIYDVGGEADVRLVNLSTRGRAGPSDEALIAGFVLNEDLPRRVLIRAVGPGLVSFKVDGALADPRIDLFSGEEMIGSNDNWTSGGSRDLIAALGRQVGAFDLEDGSRDAALTRYLDPGKYTVRVQPGEGVPGIVLVEIYVIPDVRQ